MTGRNTKLGTLALGALAGAATIWGAGGLAAQSTPLPPIKLGTLPKPAPTPTPTPAPAKSAFGSADEVYKWMLTQPLQPSAFMWQAGAPPTLLPKVETHICLLTEVSGKFNGGGEKVQLAIDSGAAGGARYVLRGESGSGATRAVAACAQRQKFVPIADKPGTGVAIEQPLRVFSACQSEAQVFKGTYPYRGAFLSTVSGNLRGGGEALTADAAGGNNLLQRGIGCSGFVAGAVTIHGDTFWPNLRYRTQTSRTTSVKTATFVNSLTQPSSSALADFFGGAQFTSSGTPMWLVPVDEALCGLTMISGKFDGYGEAAQIAAVKNSDGRMWWQLTVGNQTNGGYVGAAARCIARDQRA